MMIIKHGRLVEVVEDTDRYQAGRRGGLDDARLFPRLAQHRVEILTTLGVHDDGERGYLDGLMEGLR